MKNSENDKKEPEEINLENQSQLNKNNNSPPETSQNLKICRQKIRKEIRHLRIFKIRV